MKLLFTDVPGSAQTSSKADTFQVAGHVDEEPADDESSVIIQ